MNYLTLSGILLLVTTAPVYAHSTSNEHSEPLLQRALHVVSDAPTYDEAQVAHYEPVHYRSYRHRRYRNGYHRHGRGYYRYGHRHSYRNSYHRHNRRGYHRYSRYY